MESQNFTDSISRIFVLSLPERADRISELWPHLEEFDIDLGKTSIIPSIKNTNGALGLKETLHSVLIKNYFTQNYPLLILEDDAEFIVPKEELHEVVLKAIKELPEGWLQLYLGVQLIIRPESKYSDHLIQLPMGYSTHAIIYSKKGVETILEKWNPLNDDPIDVYFSKVIHPLGKSFCTIPMVCSQRESKSDIHSRFSSWKFCLEDKFNEYTKNLK